MFLNLFIGLREAKLPVTLREYLTMVEGVRQDLPEHDVTEFYYLARASLVKDETKLDAFDRVFGEVFKGLESSGVDGPEAVPLPEEWLRKLAEKHLSEEERKAIEGLGWDKLWETLKQRLAEQKARHQGGSKWIGTAGTSPFGAYGYNPEGVRIGQDGNRNFRAVKVWDKREFKDLKGDETLNTRTMKLALRRLRRFARTGAAEELDLDGTIRGTAHRGYLDIRMRPERRNAVKVLLFLDIGGSMDWHIGEVERLFSAAKSEFKHLEHFYFHNCPYERVWTDNKRRQESSQPMLDLLRTYGSDYRLIFVGDASMSPYEVSHPGGSVEHWNEEAGEVWMQRLSGHFRRAAWLNPVPEAHWTYTHSIQMLRKLMDGRMFPLTLEGLEGAMRVLGR
jgi:uncharacterized protein